MKIRVWGGGGLLLMCLLGGGCFLFQDPEHQILAMDVTPHKEIVDFVQQAGMPGMPGVAPPVLPGLELLLLKASGTATLEDGREVPIVRIVLRYETALYTEEELISIIEEHGFDVDFWEEEPEEFAEYQQASDFDEGQNQIRNRLMEAWMPRTGAPSPRGSRVANP